MAEPCAYHVDIDPRGHQMARNSMPKQVGSYFPPLQCRYVGRATFNEAIYAEPGVRFSVPAEEFRVAGRPSCNLLHKDALNIR